MIILRAVIQRALSGRVEVNNEVIGSIDEGVVVFLGVGEKDEEKEIRYLADKVANLRIFEDNQGKVNLSVKDIKGDVLAISQFTLYGDCRKGRRPSFSSAASPETAEDLYTKFVENLKEEHGLNVQTGMFGGHMKVFVENDGPVTILLDSDKLF